MENFISISSFCSVNYRLSSFMKNVLIIKLRYIGDVLLATPTVGRSKRRNPM